MRQAMRFSVGDFSMQVPPDDVREVNNVGRALNRMADRLADVIDRQEQTSLRLECLHGELTWRSHLSYDIERNIRRRIRREDISAVQDDLNWLESLVGVSVRATPTRRLKLVATYALYRNRGG